MLACVGLLSVAELSFTKSITSACSSKGSDSILLTSDAIRVPLTLRETCGGTFGGWFCNGFAAVAGLDGPPEPKDGGFLVIMPAMVFSPCGFPGAGDGLLEKSCFARSLLLVVGRDDWFAAAAGLAATALLNMV